MLVYGALVLILLWLSVLSFIIYKTVNHYTNLVARTKKRHLDEMLDVILKKQTLFAGEIEILHKALKDLTDTSKFYYQKIGFVRFNPFDRVGGEQSFVIVFLDGENNGILLNFLYTREGVRIYAKKLRGGKSAEYDLSQEEREAIKKAV